MSIAALKLDIVGLVFLGAVSPSLWGQIDEGNQEKEAETKLVPAVYVERGGEHSTNVLMSQAFGHPKIQRSPSKVAPLVVQPRTKSPCCWYQKVIAELVDARRATIVEHVSPGHSGRLSAQQIKQRQAGAVTFVW